MNHVVVDFCGIVDRIDSSPCPKASFDINGMGWTFGLRVRCKVAPVLN
jgi:hypothetical protein